MIFLMTPNPPPAFAAPDLGSLAWPPSFKEGTLFLFGRSNISENDILKMAIKQGLVGAVVVPPNTLVMSSIPTLFTSFLGETFSVLVVFRSSTATAKVSLEETIDADDADVIKEETDPHRQVTKWQLRMCISPFCPKIYDIGYYPHRFYFYYSSSYTT